MPEMFTSTYHTKKNYGEKLLDPRWQKKRLEVFERENYTCQYCANTEKTLHVHHLKYKKGGDPWDVDESALVCLCADCHEVSHLNNLTPLEKYLLEELQIRGLCLVGTDPGFNHFLRGITDHILNTKKNG